MARIKCLVASLLSLPHLLVVLLVLLRARLSFDDSSSGSDGRADFLLDRKREEMMNQRGSPEHHKREEDQDIPCPALG